MSEVSSRQRSCSSGKATVTTMAWIVLEFTGSGRSTVSRANRSTTRPASYRRHDTGADLVDRVGQAGVADKSLDEWGLCSGRGYLGVSELRSRGLADLGHVPTSLEFSAPKGSYERVLSERRGNSADIRPG